MQAIKISVTETQAQVIKTPVLASGIVGLTVDFTFDESWTGLTKTAVFRCGKTSLPVLCSEDSAKIPWEVLKNPGWALYVGVYGTDGEGTILPTIWVSVGQVEPGTTLPEDTPEEPTSDIYGQILSLAQKAEQTAEALRNDAREGKFTPVKGVDYWTPEEKEETVRSVLAALPTYNGEVVAV